jgi:group I intron endonuclease
MAANRVKGDATMYSLPLMGVYAIRGPKDCIYIGSAKCIQHRWRTHIHDLKKSRHHSKHLQRAWDKYGEPAFSFEILEEVVQIDDLLLVEQRWLDNIFATCPKHIIYNNVRIAGSCIGHKHSEQSRRNMSEAHKGQIHSAHTPEAKAKISAAHKGRKHTREQSDQNAIFKSGGKAYTVISPDGVVYQGIINASVFALEHGLRGNLLRMVLRGEREHTEGWTGWIEGQESKVKPMFPKYTFVDPSGVIYANIIYPGRCARQHKLTVSAVWRVLRGENKQHKGWTGFVQKE